jgi:hypothetical protein
MSTKSKALAAAQAAREARERAALEPQLPDLKVEAYRQERLGQLMGWFAEIGAEVPNGLEMTVGIDAGDPHDSFNCRATWTMEGYRYRADFVNGYQLYVYVQIPDGSRYGMWLVATTLAELGEALEKDCYATRRDAQRARRRRSKR